MSSRYASQSGRGYPILRPEKDKSGFSDDSLFSVNIEVEAKEYDKDQFVSLKTSYVVTDSSLKRAISRGDAKVWLKVETSTYRNMFPLDEEEKIIGVRLSDLKGTCNVIPQIVAVNSFSLDKSSLKPCFAKRGRTKVPKGALVAEAVPVHFNVSYEKASKGAGSIYSVVPDHSMNKPSDSINVKVTPDKIIILMPPNAYDSYVAKYRYGDDGDFISSIAVPSLMEALNSTVTKGLDEGADIEDIEPRYPWFGIAFKKQYEEVYNEALTKENYFGHSLYDMAQKVLGNETVKAIVSSTSDKGKEC